MKVLRFLAVYLFVGALACALSMFAISLFLTGYSKDYDLSPLYGVFIGGPVWLIAYPVSFAVLMEKTRNFTRALNFAVFWSSVLTVIIPFAYKWLVAR